jgi:hypothetical protein
MPPPGGTVRIVEVPPGAAVDGSGRIRIASSALHDVEQYEARFEALMQAGLPWINVSCYGVLDQHLIVAIELPAQTGARSARTSINYSGPPAAVVGNNWNADQLIALG